MPFTVVVLDLGIDQDGRDVVARFGRAGAVQLGAYAPSSSMTRTPLADGQAVRGIADAEHLHQAVDQPLLVG